MRRALPALLLLCACGSDFQPRSSVQKLRLLAVQAEPPEIGDPALGVPAASVLRSLVADAKPRRSLVIHFACTPDPAPSPSEPPPADCTTYESLASAAAFLDAQQGEGRDCSGGIAPGCINLLGAEACAPEGCAPLGPAPTYTLPAQPLAFPDLYGEVVIVSLAVATEATDPQAALADIRRAVESDPEQNDHMLAVKRISIRTARSPDAPNVNPQIAGILADGAPMDTVITFRNRGQVTLLPRLPPDCSADACPLRQRYTRVSNEGKPLESLTEAWLYSWYATAGKLERPRTLGEARTQTWFGPASDRGRENPPAPGAGGDAARMYLVVRDRRGGVAFTQAPFDIGP
jgi:hypothetical protein